MPISERGFNLGQMQKLIVIKPVPSIDKLSQSVYNYIGIAYLGDGL